jgi:uncharacterized protein (DUF1499 family)
MVMSLAAIGTAALGLLLLALAGPLYRVGLPLEWAFGMFRVAAYVGLIAVVAGIVAGTLAYRRKAWLSIAVSAVALLLGIGAVAIPLTWQQRAQAAPPIYDVTTDLENPPAFKAILPLRADASNPLERSPQLADLQRKGYGDLAPITLPAAPGQVFEKALRMTQQEGWAVADADKQAGVIEATDTTPWFGFEDDIVIRLTPWGSGTRVDVRSASRVGLNDMGTNARRIRAFLEELGRE